MYARGLLKKADPKYRDERKGGTGHVGYHKPTHKKIIGGARNPWAWYVSHWAYRPLLRYPSYCEYLKGVFSGARGAWTGMPCKEFTKMDIGMLTALYIKFYYPQYKEKFQKLRQGEDVFEVLKNGCNVDFFYKTESLNQDLINIFKEVGVTFNIKKHMHTGSLSKQPYDYPHEHYATYYTEELKKLVKHKDRYLINKFDYTFSNGDIITSIADS